MRKNKCFTIPFIVAAAAVAAATVAAVAAAMISLNGPKVLTDVEMTQHIANVCEVIWKI